MQKYKSSVCTYNSLKHRYVRNVFGAYFYAYSFEKGIRKNEFSNENRDEEHEEQAASQDSSSRSDPSSGQSQNLWNNATNMLRSFFPQTIRVYVSFEFDLDCKARDCQFRVDFEKSIQHTARSLTH